VRVAPFDTEANLDGGFLDVQANNDTNRVDLFVFGNEERFVTVARLDNLGKGASGAAIQCMNLAIGTAEDSGLKR
jgi:N-acetyl-gamma-glutamyl-phosphate reductase